MIDYDTTRVSRAHINLAERKFADIKAVRKASKLNQTEFWRMFGVTQSGGSRFETGRDVSHPVAMLMMLHELGYVREDQLVEISLICERAGLTRAHRGAEGD